MTVLKFVVWPNIQEHITDRDSLTNSDILILKTARTRIEPLGSIESETGMIIANFLISRTDQLEPNKINMSVASRQKKTEKNREDAKLNSAER